MSDRIRDRSELESLNWSGKWYRLSDNALVNSTVGTVSWVNHDRMEDVLIPRFKSRSGNGEIFVNPMVKHTSKAVQSRGSWGSKGKTQRYVNESNPERVTPFDLSKVTGDIDRLEALAVTEAYSKVGSPALETLTELVELKETLTFLVSPVKKIVQITSRARNYQRSYDRWLDAYNKRLARWEALSPKAKKNRPKPERKPPTQKWGEWNVTDITSLWLAYRYALMPLVYTIQDIQGLIEERAKNERPTRATARGKSNDIINGGTTRGFTDSLSVDGFSGAIRYKFWDLFRYDITCRAGVLYAPDWSLNARLGFQINRIPKALYEGIPLSFITDWFHNGAEYYDALTADFRALKVHGAWVVTTVSYSLWTESEMTPAPGTVYTTISNGERKIAVSNNGTWKRRRKASLGDVKFLLRLEMNGKRIADGLALSYNMLDAALRRKK